MPGIERTFADGKMVITFPNGRTREVTVEQLQQRKDNVDTSVERRTAALATRIEKMTERVAAEQDAEKKAKMQERLTKMQERQGNLPTAEEIKTRLQGWIDEANASA